MSNQREYILRLLDEKIPYYVCYPEYMFDENKSLDEHSFYEHGGYLLFLTEPIKITKECIPIYNHHYHPDPNPGKRGHFYIAKTNNTGSLELFEGIKKIDDYFDNEINVKKNKGCTLCYRNKMNGRRPFRNITYVKMIDIKKKRSTS